GSWPQIPGLTGSFLPLGIHDIRFSHTLPGPNVASIHRMISSGTTTTGLPATTASAALVHRFLNRCEKSFLLLFLCHDNSPQLNSFYFRIRYLA
ncbi:MAG: hypothetical protein WC110_08750, partial [Bacteroidales bacterium]